MQRGKLILGLAAVLIALLTAPVCGQNPVGMGRPPGFGPELDRQAISYFKELQRFISADLGWQPDPRGGAGKVRDGVMTRVFWGAWRLESPYRQKFLTWKRSFLATPGMTVLNIFTHGMPYLMTHMCIDYNGSALGDYTIFRFAPSAYAQLAKDCKKFYEMAQGYIDRLEARLKFEEAHPSSPGTGVNPNDDGSPITILDVWGEQGRAKVDQIMRDRLRNKGIK